MDTATQAVLPHVEGCCIGGVIEKNGVRLLTLDEWRVHAPPKSEVHWKDGRSAKESARSWLAAAPSLPAEIAATLSSHHHIGPLSAWRAEPEAHAPFDDFPGEPPNIDVLLVGRDKNGPIVVAVEAKADERFGSTVQQKLSSFQSNPQSNGVKRIERLRAALFGELPNQPDIGDLRYQLLTATVAAMAEAKRQSAQRAVVMIHEFVTPLTTDKNRYSNARDLNQFVARISGRQDPLKPRTLLGPFKVPGKPIVETEISLYFGKAVVDINFEEKLRRIAEREDNWDGKGSKKPNPLVLSQARDTLESFLFSVINSGRLWKTPFVSSDEDGRITIQWNSGNHELHLEIREEGTEYIKVWGANIENDMHLGLLKPEDFFKLWDWLNE